jgi:calcium/calmodulin-dependent protein kinase I
MGCSDSKPIEVCESFEDKYSVSNIELGRGAFSVVMEGTLRKTGAKVAIKFVNTEASMNKTGLDFEVEIQKRLNHPNVIKLYDCYYTPGNYTIIEEYVSGHDLYDRVLLRNHYSEKDARDLMRILVNTVNYLHGMNVVHRDLKPENVLLTSPDSDSDIKICDFGFATYASRETLTEFKGTPNFVGQLYDIIY